MPQFRGHRLLRHVHRNFQLAVERRVAKKFLCEVRDIIEQICQRVIARINCPHRFIQRPHKLLRGLGNFLQLALGFWRHFVWAGLSERTDLRHARSQFVVNVPGNTGAFLFQGCLYFQRADTVFNALALVHFHAQLAGALLDPATQLKNPQCRQRNQDQQSACEHKRIAQRPARRQLQDRNVLRRI